MPRLLSRKRLAGVLLVFVLLLGTALGVGAYTFYYAEGASYLTDDPEACVNCHVMRDQFDGWLKSGHHHVATCNDCHTPKGFVSKYYVKARNGWHHSVAFTTGRFHEPIRITPFNRAVTQGACRQCHSEVVAQIDAHPGVRGELDCIRCHRQVGHP